MDIIINKKPVSIPFLPIAAGIAATILVFSSIRIASVGGDEVGVFISNMTGKVSVKLNAGSSLYNGIITDFYTLKKTERTIKMNHITIVLRLALLRTSNIPFLNSIVQLPHLPNLLITHLLQKALVLQVELVVVRCTGRG